jgi:hypothetical protein
MLQATYKLGVKCLYNKNTTYMKVQFCNIILPLLVLIVQNESRNFYKKDNKYIFNMRTSKLIFDILENGSKSPTAEAIKPAMQLILDNSLVGYGYQGGRFHLTSEANMGDLGTYATNTTTSARVKMANGEIHELKRGVDTHKPTSMLIGPYKKENETVLEVKKDMY